MTQYLSSVGLVVSASIITADLTLPKHSYALGIGNHSDYIDWANLYAQNAGTYDDFLSALAKRETGAGNPTYSNTNNQWGFIGKYQFGEALLIDLGYYTSDVYYGQSGIDKNYWHGEWTGKGGVNSKEEFLGNKNNVQEIAIREAMQLRWNRINTLLIEQGKSLDEFINQPIEGIAVTKSGILAAGHLRGEVNTTRLLLENYISRDEQNTSILAYLNEFAGYDVPF
ncbi:hypothetical protein [Laspinema olomoucense]|nr:hypothetical protein [Laspinema sp. D3b]